MHIYEIVKNLADIGNKIYLVAYHPEADKNKIHEFNGIKIIRTKPSRINLFKTLVKVIKKYNIDVIYYRFNFEAIAPILASCITGRKLTYEVNGIAVGEAVFQNRKYNIKLMLLGALTRISLKFADMIIAISEGIKNILVKWGIEKNKIFHVPNGANIKFLNPTLTGDNIKKRYNLKNKRVLLIVSGLHPWHGILDFIEAINLIKEKIPDTVALIVGSGKMYNTIKDKIFEYNLQEKIILAGRVPYLEVPEIIAAGDIAIAPFVKNKFLEVEGATPLKIFEYMAAGKPIIATKIGEVDKYIKNGYNGILVEPGDIKGLAKNILELLSDPIKADKLGKNARHTIVEKYSWRKIGEKITNLLYNLKIKKVTNQ
ncbi:MAG: glycosyltransferase family 4 protein [Candidatus Odinarchaeia archaeon]